MEGRTFEIPAPPVQITADLVVPPEAAGLVIFAHGSGSSRLSPRNRQVASTLNESRLATLLLDLLRVEEELDRANVFDVALLSSRLVAATRWAQTHEETRGLPVGYFGASTGAAAALCAAAILGDAIGAVVSRGGRPDMAEDCLERVSAPTLLIVGGADDTVLALNEEAAGRLRAPHQVEVVPGATHLFEEPGALERVAELAAAWFEEWLLAARR
jgi:pimeloyl-ACP methyl ester carboxylesterase